MPPATQEPTNMTAVYAARLARHVPYYKEHRKPRASTSVSKRRERPLSSNVYKRRDPDPASPVIDKRIDKRCDNTSFDVSKRSDDEAYPSVLSKVLYCCW